MPPEPGASASACIIPPSSAGAERAGYDGAHEDYHARLVIVSTPAIRHVAAIGRKRILLNRHQHPAAAGLIVSGLAGTGKTTAVSTTGRRPWSNLGPSQVTDGEGR